MTDTLRIAIVHYHLRPGGVTRIVEQTALALAARGGVRLAVLTGSPAPAHWPDMGIPTGLVEGLNYADHPQPHPAPLLERLRATAVATLGAPPGLWHVHNHSLGLHPALTQAVHQLANAGERLLLHSHEFPEDGRPANYRTLLTELGGGDHARLYAQLYPAAPHVHYAVLNQRDLGFMRSAGANTEELHLLANPVAAPCAIPPPTDPPHAGERVFLYPTRALRRKNLGEMLLWAALAPKGTRVAATLAPTSCADRSVYEEWKRFALNAQLPVDFEVGLRPGAAYPRLVQAAKAILTTSVAEGFGLAFLEPWLANRPLVGRLLPEITADFAAAGISLQSLYDRLLVPLAWVGHDRYAQAVKSALGASAAAFGRRAGAADVERALASAITDSHVDFGRLDESGQAAVIRHLLDHPTAQQHVRPHTLEPGLAEARARLDANRLAVASRYGVDAYASRLLAIYGALTATAPAPIQALNGDALLDAFLAPERFCLLRT